MCNLVGLNCVAEKWWKKNTKSGEKWIHEEMLLQSFPVAHVACWMNLIWKSESLKKRNISGKFGIETCLLKGLSLFWLNIYWKYYEKENVRKLQCLVHQDA